MWNKRLSVFSNAVSVYRTRPNASRVKLEFLVFIQLLLWIILANAQYEKIPWTHVAHFHFYIVNITAIIFAYRKMYSWLKNSNTERVLGEPRTGNLVPSKPRILNDSQQFRAAHLCKNWQVVEGTTSTWAATNTWPYPSCTPGRWSSPERWKEGGLSLLQARIAAGSSCAYE